MAVLVPDEPGLALWKLNRDALPLHLGDHFVLRDGHVVALLLCYCVAFPPAIKLIDCHSIAIGIVESVITRMFLG